MLWSLVYELGRPKPKTEEEIDDEMAAWGVFVSFADRRLERKGRCHFLEIANAFRRQYPEYVSRPPQQTTLGLERPAVSSGTLICPFSLRKMITVTG